MSEGKSVFQNLPLSDNFIFGEVMRDENICRMFLEELLHIRIERIVVSKEETVSDTPAFHGIRLDVLAKGEKEFFDVEMFSDPKHKPPLRRARYYQGMLDRRALEVGKDYVQLPESYIVFVCNFDYFSTGQAVCRRKMVIEGREDVTYDDGSHVYILNSEYTDGNSSPAILEFLDCIRLNDLERSYESDLMKAICPAVKAVRGNPEKEEEYMVLQTVLMDERRYAREETIRKIILSLFDSGTAPEKIALGVEKPLIEVLKILKDAGKIS